jgi:formamidopyrimidine-DNA glycosylase
MPELPEVEAWRRALNDPVSAFPIEQAGPAHVATLKTFDPPLSALQGRRSGFSSQPRTGCSS